MSHGKHIFQTASDIAMAKICAYTSSNYVLPHWKCFFSCYSQCLCMDLPSPESDQQNSNISSTIPFHVYQHIENCIVYGRRPISENNQCQLCETSTDSIITEKNYTRKEIFTM